MKKSIICVFLLFAGLAMMAAAKAKWTGPTVILSGGWGAGDNDFAMAVGDSSITHPRVTAISVTGDIAISDQENGRVEIYDSTGKLKFILTPPVANPKLQTYDPKFIVQNIVIPLEDNFFYSDSGKLTLQAPYPGGDDIFGREIDGDWYIATNKDSKVFWLEYAPSGTLISTYTDKPLIMGQYKKEVTVYQGSKLYRTIIKYPDATWTRVDKDDGCTEYSYIRDSKGTVYCRLDKYVARFSRCGKKVAEFTMPEDDVDMVDMGTGVDPTFGTINALYGEVTLAPNGDIYTSRTANSEFSIIKWTWQNSPDDPVGGPDAPVQLGGVSDTTGSVMLK
ncbi:MAG: hypothetical protein ACREHG_03370, partial [Candidatus Saccharimonadales bacterium]